MTKFTTLSWLVEPFRRRRLQRLKKELGWPAGRRALTLIQLIRLKTQRRYQAAMRVLWRQQRRSMATRNTTTWLVWRVPMVRSKQPLSRLPETWRISTNWICQETLPLLVSSLCQITQTHVWLNYQLWMASKMPSKVDQLIHRETFWDSSCHQPTRVRLVGRTVTWESVVYRMPSPLVSIFSITQTRVTKPSERTQTKRTKRTVTQLLVSVQLTPMVIWQTERVGYSTRKTRVRELVTHQRRKILYPLVF